MYVLKLCPIIYCYGDYCPALCQSNSYLQPASLLGWIQYSHSWFQTTAATGALQQPQWEVSSRMSKYTGGKNQPKRTERQIKIFIQWVMRELLASSCELIRPSGVPYAYRVLTFELRVKQKQDYCGTEELLKTGVLNQELASLMKDPGKWSRRWKSWENLQNFGTRLGPRASKFSSRRVPSLIQYV